MATELLAPAGSTDALRAAFAAGADAVYIGGIRFGARAFAENPEDKELLENIHLAHRLGKKLYLTVNTLLKEEELERELPAWIRPFYEAGLDAVIVQDLGVAALLRECFPGLPLHASTQMAITGTYGARLLEGLGFTRVVPARELSLREIKDIKKHSSLEIETFVHGALCYSYSGQCLMSSMIGGRSGNRGRCAGICRLPYRLLSENGREMGPANRWLLNMKDLCTVDDLAELVHAGICSFKIEGRMKKPEYVAGVTSVYRRVLDAVLSGDLPAKATEDERERLIALYSRDGFTGGYYHQKNGPDMIALKNEKLQGARMQSAQREIEHIRAELDEKMGTALQKPVRGHVTLRRGKPSSCRVSTDVSIAGQSVSLTEEVFGDVPQLAKNRPLDPEMIRTQFLRTGGAAYSFSSLELDVDEDLFVPLSALNALRREAFAALDNKIRLTFARNAEAAVQNGQSDLSVPETTARRAQAITEPEERSLKLFAEVTTEGQLDALLRESRINGMYLPLRLAHRAPDVRDCGKTCALALPYVMRGSCPETESAMGRALDFYEWDRILLRTTEEVGWYCTKREEQDGKIPEALLDALLYAYNNRAAKVWKDMGFLLRTMPYEMHFRELRQMDTAGGEIVLYGRTPVMISAQCIKKTTLACDSVPAFVHLKDRKGMAFPVWSACDSCSNVLFNSIPTALLGESEAIRHLRCGSGRLLFTTEQPEECVQIAEDYVRVFVHGEASGTRAPCNAQTTRGHFLRGIE